MIVTYKFNTENDEDRHKLKCIQQATEMNSLIWDFSNNTKRRTALLEEKEHDGYQKAMDDFFRMKEENDVREI